MVQVSGAGLSPSQRQVAAATVGRRPRTGSPATGLAGGGGDVVGCDFFFFPCLLLCCCSYRLLVRREKTGKTPAVVQHPAAAADRVTPIWTAGGWRTGLPTGGLAGVGQGRSGHGQTARPLATTAGGRRSGSPLVGRPAGLCQGRPLRSGPPLGPTTFRVLLTDERHPLGCSRDSGEVCCPGGRKAAGRRRVGREAAAATAWWYGSTGASRECVVGRRTRWKPL